MIFMTSIDGYFFQLCSNVSLSADDKEALRTSRDALRQKVRNYFQDNEKGTPKFSMQGSFPMGTTVKIKTEQDFDLDDGIYLVNHQDEDSASWPKPSTVHSWIYSAVDGHTKSSPSDKNTCVRVFYAGGYHIDLPSYIISDDVAYLAHKRDGWVESDPKAFLDWFQTHAKEKEHLKNLVRCLKAWNKYKKIGLDGITITILASNHYEHSSSLVTTLENTLTEIQTSLTSNFECKKPVVPEEDLLADTSETTKNRVLSQMGILLEALEDINSTEVEVACQNMRRFFGEDFPTGITENKENYEKTAAPAVISSNGRSG